MEPRLLFKTFVSQITQASEKSPPFPQKAKKILDLIFSCASASSHSSEPKGPADFQWYAKKPAPKKVLNDPDQKLANRAAKLGA